VLGDHVQFGDGKGSWSGTFVEAAMGTPPLTILKRNPAARIQSVEGEPIEASEYAA
jgi:hypothetical protein